jgi:RNA polymerase II subunit A-like phosphatase
MAEAHTGVHTPTYLPYPVKIMKLLVTPDTAISRGTALCNYSFEHLLPPERPTKPGGSPPPRKKETRYETWESPVDGIVQRWQVRPGDIITTESATKNPAIMILCVSVFVLIGNTHKYCITSSEECTHKVQIHGLCAICGKDMTKYIYFLCPST